MACAQHSQLYPWLTRVTKNSISEAFRHVYQIIVGLITVPFAGAGVLAFFVKLLLNSNNNVQLKSPSSVCTIIIADLGLRIAVITCNQTPHPAFAESLSPSHVDGCLPACLVMTDPAKTPPTFQVVWARLIPPLSTTLCQHNPCITTTLQSSTLLSSAVTPEQSRRLTAIVVTVVYAHTQLTISIESLSEPKLASSNIPSCRDQAHHFRPTTLIDS